MRWRTRLAVLVVALAVSAATAPTGPVWAGGAGQREPAGPHLVKTPTREQVWLVEGGQRRWVADAAAFGARGYRWDDVTVVAPASLRLLAVGPALHDGPLLRDGATGDVYLVGDGQARRVPDPLTFALYGLDWSRVQTVDPGALARYPRGTVLPHALTGQALPDVPTSLAPPPARALRAGADPRLAEPLRLVREYPPTAAWPAFLDRYGVVLRVEPVAGGLASYRASDRTLTVDPEFATADARAVATLLVHETLHAIYDAGHRSGEAGRACIEEEVQAFSAQSAFWAHEWGPDGRPDPATELERELNRTLAAAADDALVGRVITSFGYTLRCYLPDGGGPPERS
jgi:hypothetical protein